MYTKDKSKQVTVRLSEEQYSYLKSTADQLEVTPSKFLRMVVNSTMLASRKGVRMIYNTSSTGSSEGVTVQDGDN